MVVVKLAFDFRQERADDFALSLDVVDYGVDESGGFEGGHFGDR
jgi:hypothetical protein